MHTLSPKAELEFACQALDVIKIKKLLDEGADPNAQADDGCTPVFFALSAHVEVDSDTLYQLRACALDLLFSAGADPNAAWNEGIDYDAEQTALEMAANATMHTATMEQRVIQSATDLMETILKAGADPEPLALMDGRYRKLPEVIVWWRDNMLTYNETFNKPDIVHHDDFLASCLALLGHYGAESITKNPSGLGLVEEEIAQIEQKMLHFKTSQTHLRQSSPRL